ncbi:nucleotide kinase domain-containing protein [Novosphingobium sp. Gsoil 351]|uniref:nucleotide kinase domain-containing protein n=1 Tax=Novosphingobium sp. Gsoil 351 TaxID=2675225 RepID=UPI0012B4588F|nr:nucleotide kinase domain-containing protein [Novosphingobium sp. Gsoil 351]QGN55913.1 hypothetical protein GKE62_16480 [Novosphingobium sp. Gsoil 351]
MRTTAVYDTYWRFAAERQAVYLRRLDGQPGPWTDDPVLRRHRFTNCYRAADRVSQFLISEVQYGPHRSPAPAEVFFRTMLFKLFNRVSTWHMLERSLGHISWQSADPELICQELDRAIDRGTRVYSAAYIMPSPNFGHSRKHRNHIALLWRMMDLGLPGQMAATDSLQEAYKLLLDQPGLGPFLAFQFAIDLNYSTLMTHEESEFVVAGPGALDGISKCFADVGRAAPEDVIHWVCERQEREFAQRGLDFPGLFGRRLQPIDCQNLFCEISKYARVAHPDVVGRSGRTRIKQLFAEDRRPLPAPQFPPRWHVVTPGGLGGRVEAPVML